MTGIELVRVQDAIFPRDYHKKSHMVFIDYSCVAKNPDEIILNHELQEYEWVKPERALEMNLNDSTRRFIQGFINRSREIC